MSARPTRRARRIRPAPVGVRLPMRGRVTTLETRPIEAGPSRALGARRGRTIAHLILTGADQVIDRDILGRQEPRGVTVGPIRDQQDRTPQRPSSGITARNWAAPTVVAVSVLEMRCVSNR